MIQREYNALTSEWTEIEIPAPKPVSEYDMVPRAEGDYIINEIFQFAGETYRALTNINKEDKLILGANCELIDLIKLLNEQNDELKAAKILLGVD